MCVHQQQRRAALSALLMAEEPTAVNELLYLSNKRRKSLVHPGAGGWHGDEVILIFIVVAINVALSRFQRYSSYGRRGLRTGCCFHSGKKVDQWKLINQISKRASSGICRGFAEEHPFKISNQPSAHLPSCCLASEIPAKNVSAEPMYLLNQPTNPGVSLLSPS